MDWITRKLVDSWTTQLAKLFNAKFGVNTHSKGDNYKFAVSKLTSL